MNSTAQPAIDPKLPTGPPLKTALKIVSRSPQTRASNAARAALVVADVTPTGYRVGLFMAGHARYATEADVRRNVSPGELFSYWKQAKIAAGLGCSERQVRRGVRSMREAGTLEVRRRVRPCEASYVWLQPVLSGVRSDVRSHTEPRTEPQKNHVRSSRARVVCSVCGNSWPDKAEYGTRCYKCRHDPSTVTPGDKPTIVKKPKSTPCTCGGSYRNSHGNKCLDCEGKPSAAQRSAVREKDGGGGAHEGGGADGGVVRAAGPWIDAPPLEAVASTPILAEIVKRPPKEPENDIPPDGGEPGPNERRFKAQWAKWTIGKRTRLQHGSDRRRKVRAARHDLADLAEGRTG